VITVLTPAITGELHLAAQPISYRYYARWVDSRNQDLYDRLQADDLKQAAAVVAWITYNAATSDEFERENQ
jgi:hypothetical protein